MIKTKQVGNRKLLANKAGFALSYLDRANAELEAAKLGGNVWQSEESGFFFIELF